MCIYINILCVRRKCTPACSNAPWQLGAAMPPTQLCPQAAR